MTTIDLSDRLPDSSPRYPLWGIDLRHVLTVHLYVVGPRSVDELVTAVLAAGFVIDGRPSKVVSDALRWEIRRGRVVRLGRGRYGPGTMPKSTRSWMHQRVRVLHAERTGRAKW